MYCRECGAETESKDQLCDQCQGKLTVLSPRERDSFSGVTLEDPERASRFEESPRDSGRQYTYRQVHFSSGGSWMSKLILLAVVVGFLLVALPLALFILGTGLLVWGTRRWLRGR